MVPTSSHCTSTEATRLRQLKTLEVVLDELLTVGVVSTILKEKLYAVEEMVMALEDNDKEAQALANTWRGKLAVWWKMYALVEDKAYSAKTPGMVESPTKKQQQGASLLAPPPLIEDDFTDDQCYREYLSSQLKNAFAELADVTSAADLAGMKQLINLIVRAFDLVPPSHADGRLQTAIFEAAFMKLSTDMRRSFIAQYDPPFQLHQIFSYLRLEIDDYWENNKLLLLPTQMSANRCPRGSHCPKETIEEGGQKQVHCGLCHREDHTANACPELEQLWCHRCYQFAGHSTGRCAAPIRL